MQLVGKFCAGIHIDFLPWKLYNIDNLHPFFPQPFYHSTN